MEILLAGLGEQGCKTTMIDHSLLVVEPVMKLLVLF